MAKCRGRGVPCLFIDIFCPGYFYRGGKECVALLVCEDQLQATALYDFFLAGSREVCCKGEVGHSCFDDAVDETDAVQGGLQADAYDAVFYHTSLQEVMSNAIGPFIKLLICPGFFLHLDCRSFRIFFYPGFKVTQDWPLYGMWLVGVIILIEEQVLLFFAKQRQAGDGLIRACCHLLQQGYQVGSELLYELCTVFVCPVAGIDVVVCPGGSEVEGDVYFGKLFCFAERRYL